MPVCCAYKAELNFSEPCIAYSTGCGPQDRGLVIAAILLAVCMAVIQHELHQQRLYGHSSASNDSHAADVLCQNALLPMFEC